MRSVRDAETFCHYHGMRTPTPWEWQWIAQVRGTVMMVTLMLDGSLEGSLLTTTKPPISLVTITLLQL